MNSKNSTANVVRTRARSAKSRKLAGRVGTKRRGRSIRKTSHKVARKRSARKLKRRSIRKNRFGGIELIQRKSSTSSNPFPTPAVGDGSMRRLSTSSRDSAFPTLRSSASTASTASAFAESQTSKDPTVQSFSVFGPLGQNSINSQSSGLSLPSSVGSRGSVDSENEQVVPADNDESKRLSLPSSVGSLGSDDSESAQVEPDNDSLPEYLKNSKLPSRSGSSNALPPVSPGTIKKVSFWDRWDRLKRPFSKIGTTTPATPEPPKKKISWNPFAAKEKEPIKNNLSPEQMKQLRNKRIDLTGPVTEPEIVDLTRTPGGPVTYQNFPVSDKTTPGYYKYIKEPIDNTKGPTSTGQNYTIAPRNVRVLGPGYAIVDPDEVPTIPTGFDKYNQIPKKYKSIDGVIAEVSKICDEIKKAKAAAKEIKD